MTDVFMIESFENLIKLYKQLGGESTFGVKVEGYVCIEAIIGTLENNYNAATPAELIEIVNLAKVDLSHMMIIRAPAPKEEIKKIMETSVPLSILPDNEHCDKAAIDRENEICRVVSERLKEREDIDREAARRVVAAQTKNVQKQQGEIKKQMNTPDELEEEEPTFSQVKKNKKKIIVSTVVGAVVVIGVGYFAYKMLND